MGSRPCRHYQGFSPAASNGALDAWGTICGLAAVTARLRLATLVSPVTLRHPSVLSKLVATADRISDGRVEVGLGSGWHAGEHETYGFELPPLAQRIRLLEDQLRVLRHQWSSGVHLPPPVQQPGVPIIAGGSGGARSLAVAARYADEYNMANVGPGDLPVHRRRLDEACERAGREPIRLSVMTGMVIAPSEADVRRRVEQMRTASGGRAPGPTAIAGTSATVLERLREYADAGADRVFLGLMAHRDLEPIELLGREVLPAIAAAATSGDAR